MSKHTGARRRGHPDGAHWYGSRSARWTSHARRGHRKSRIHRFHRTLCHLHDSLFAYHPIRSQGIRRHTEQAHFHFLRISHNTAFHTGRAARNGRQCRCHTASRTTLGSRHAPSLVRQSHFDGLGDFIEDVLTDGNARISRFIYRAELAIHIFIIASDGNHGRIVGGVAKLGDIHVPFITSCMVEKGIA